ncbi:hypothetical protein N0V90_000791 [Kalmusia sp. IMI 367209]|nr:hypothetical protein N0V90_000791 [Kalmusia sp. IMI 367209]
MDTNNAINEFLARKFLPAGIISPSPSPSTLPTTSSSTMKPRIPKLPPAASKANNMRVFISGFVGMHPIEIGVAYWHRGHYIYSAAGIPIEPIQFATKKVDTAPLLQSDAPENRPEYEVAALYRSMVHAWEEREEREKAVKRAEEGGAFAEQNEEIQRLTPKDGDAKSKFKTERAQRAIASQAKLVASDDCPSLKERTDTDRSAVAFVQACAPETEGEQRYPQGIWFELPENEANYNDRALFLAKSAPGSHHNTPTPSCGNTPGNSRAASPTLFHHEQRHANAFRAVASTSKLQQLSDGPEIDLRAPSPSPAPSQRDQGHTGSFRPVTSMPRLDQLPEEGPVIDSLVALQGKNPELTSLELLNPRSVNAYTNTVSNAGSQPPSRAHSRVPSGLFMSGIESKVAQGTSRPPTSRNTSIHKDVPGPSMTELVKARQKTPAQSSSRIGRPRKDSWKAASIALNEAIFRSGEEGIRDGEGNLLKCPVHGGDCDGVTVVNDHLTEKNRKGKGFKEVYPVLTNHGRTMIDWLALVEEEK